MTPPPHPDNPPGSPGVPGPYPGQYPHPHVYARNIHHPDGPCICGATLGDGRHTHAAPGVTIPDHLRWATTPHGLHLPELPATTLCPPPGAYSQWATRHRDIGALIPHPTAARARAHATRNPAHQLLHRTITAAEWTHTTPGGDTP